MSQYAPSTLFHGRVPLTAAQLADGNNYVQGHPSVAGWEQRHNQFRARLRAASYSRVAMAEVMAEQLQALGYDVDAWDGAQWTRVCP